MATTIVLRSDQRVIRDKPIAQVWTRESWHKSAAQWTLASDLLLENLQLASSGGISQATFRYHYGVLIDGINGTRYVEPVDLTHRWVKVQITPDIASQPTITWYGVLVREQRRHMGARLPDGQPAGDQHWTAYGVEYLFTRWQITQSILYDPIAVAYVTINRALDFNGFKTDRHGTRIRQANRDPSVARFAMDLSGNNGAKPRLWSARSIVSYLFATRMDVDWVRTSITMPLFLELGIPFELDYEPELVKTQGKTVHDILSELFSHKRGLMWWMEPYVVSGDTEGFQIKVDSLSAGGLDLTEFDRTIKPNANRIALDLYDAHDIVSAIEVVEQSTKYKRVKVTGGKQGAVFTVSIDTGELVADWTASDKSEYLLALLNHPGYSTVDISERCTWNDHYRKSELLKHVYTRFKVTDTWDGRAGVNNKACFPDVNAYEWDKKVDEMTDLHPLWMHGMRFLPYLPVYEKEDLNTASNETVDKSKPGSIPDYQPPIIVGQIPDYNGSGSAAWALLDQFHHASGWDEILAKDGSNLDVKVRVHENQFGFSLIPSGMPHMLQLDDIFYDDLPVSGGQSIGMSHQAEGDLDYKKIYVTLYAQCDHEIYQHYPGDIDDVDVIHDMYDTLVIRLGDRARLDYLVPETVIGVSEGLPSSSTLVKSPVGRTLRDDRPLMKDLAFRAYTWYAAERNVLALSLNTLRTDLAIGQLITRIQIGTPDTLVDTNDEPIVDTDGEAVVADDDSNRTIETVITNLTYDVERGTMNVQTQFMEVDFAELAYV